MIENLIQDIIDYDEEYIWEEPRKAINRMKRFLLERYRDKDN